MTTNSQSLGQDGDRLDSWKEIAAYLGKNVRTALRWSKDQGMPVYRHAGGKSGAVYAYRSEIDEWIHSDRSAPPRPYRKSMLLWAGAAIVLALALVYFAFDRFVQVPKTVTKIVEETAQQARSVELVESYGEKSIAVLPFVNMSSDPEQEYFSDGISEELLSRLAQVPGLRVIARTSSFSYKGTDIKISDVARQLNVGYVLEGAVRRDGNRVRITAQLIDARSDKHLWSEAYDRTLDDIFAIQDEIAGAVVVALKLTLLGEKPKAAKVNPEAYTLYLQAKHLNAIGGAENLKKANEMLKQVLDIAPDYAQAWRILYKNYVSQVRHLLIPEDEGIALALEAVNQALTIDPDFAEAHATLGWNALVLRGDLKAAARHFEHALSLDPTNRIVLSNASILLEDLGRWDEVIAIREYDVALDPLNPIAHNNLCGAYLATGQPDKAIATARTLLMLSPERPAAHLLLGKALLMKGENEAALEAVQQESWETLRLAGLVEVYHVLGQAAESDAALAELIEKQHDAYYVAGVLAIRGEADRAFQWLYKMAHLSPMHSVQVGPRFNNLHDDPRWLPFLESIGRSPEQLAAIEFNVTLPE
jgi:TolB-like protein/Flp pilus assembly protein TadD/predicted DNA-binding transcriptional regulator AlpA